MTKKPEEDFHFYAATPYSWATASTRQEAITKVAIEAGKDTIDNAKKNGKHGLIVYTTRVLHPESESYSIQFYVPTNLSNGDPVKKDKEQVYYIVNTKGHVMVHEGETIA